MDVERQHVTVDNNPSQEAAAPYQFETKREGLSTAGQETGTYRGAR
jgi:hypothetical protein